MLPLSLRPNGKEESYPDDAVHYPADFSLTVQREELHLHADSPGQAGVSRGDRSTFL